MISLFWKHFFGVILLTGMSPSRPGNIFATDFRPKSNIAFLFNYIAKISWKKYSEHPNHYNFSIQSSFHDPPVPNLFFREMSVLDLPEIPVKNVFRDYASWKLRNTLLRITCQVEWIISIVNDFIMVTEWFWYSRWPVDLPEFPVKMCFGDIGIWKFSWPKYSWWSPDSWFSDNVDIFCKKSHRKILPEKKVTTSNFSIIFQNTRMRNSYITSRSQLLGWFLIKSLHKTWIIDWKCQKIIKVSIECNGTHKCAHKLDYNRDSEPISTYRVLDFLGTTWDLLL